ACDPDSGCTNEPNTAPCDDDDVCTLGDVCAGGDCTPGAEELVCDDENPCTNDGCDPDSGCQVVGSVDDGTSCGEDKVCQAGTCTDDAPAQSCLTILQSNPNAGDGTYQIDPDGAGGEDPFSVYCDMTQDSGGWTLVFRDNMDGPMVSDHPAAINPSALEALSGATGKLDDGTINALRSQTDESITYRLDSPNVASRYFVPGVCTYTHTGNHTDECARYRTSYEGGANISYTQCVNWGGGAGGINIWYGCGGNSNYTNVVKTHSDVSRGMACITNNPAGNSKGHAGGVVQSGAPLDCGYSSPLLMWVR
ncbi:MAG: fibrinogen-like YCDxxxxGGGW domain-containing protein, partial [Myxococcota bacterium]|nr:fibrinogen-like YCDxxxxGGGW domain-containing protein [Myxococcota bacterium]